MAKGGNLNGRAVFALTAGGILLYSGIAGKSVSGAIRNVLMGNSPATAPASDAIEGTPQEAFASDVAAAAGTSTAQQLGNGGDAAKNKAIARLLAAPYGWSTGQQWQALDNLWTRESGWNRFAFNASSGATGIPQALPATKMPLIARLPSQGGMASASAQIAWGLNYIKTRPDYGSPMAAWQHEQQFGWY